MTAVLPGAVVKYCTLAAAKAYLEIPTADTDKDDLIDEFIEDASREIDQYCDRHFYGVYDTRYYHAIDDIGKRRQYNMLFVDEDLLSVETLTNGDGNEISSTNYVLVPYNDDPKYGIQLKTNTTTSWTWSGAPERSISVTGTWGYNSGTTAPKRIERLTVRLVGWKFSQLKGTYTETGFPEIGQVVKPVGMPEDVQRSLDDRFVRIRVGSIGRDR